MTGYRLEDYRVLVVPGLYNSDEPHWQSRWQRLHPRYERVQQDDWDHPQLSAWSQRLDALRALDRRPTLIVAHSFGCLTAAHSIAGDARGVAGVLLVAPADPDKFGVAALLPQTALPCPSTVISSSDDPWMSLTGARLWAGRWNSRFIDIGACGHINGASNLGDWPFGQQQLQQLVAQETLRASA